MQLRTWLFSNMMIRNMLADFGWRNEGSRSIAYSTFFQYRIGRYQSGDFFLYFPKQPFWEQYRNEGFNKLRELATNQVTSYVEFHFEKFADKQAFLSFVKTELKSRLASLRNFTIRRKLEIVHEWLTEKEKALNVFVNPVSAIYPDETKSLLAERKNSLNADIEKLINRVDSLLSVKQLEFADIEERIKDVLQALPTGKIQLNNPQLEPKLIMLLFLISNLTAPGRKGGGNLFKIFGQADISSILKTHVVNFKSIKYTSIQKNVGEIVSLLNWRDPELINLQEALTKFFFN